LEIFKQFNLYLQRFGSRDNKAIDYGEREFLCVRHHVLVWEVLRYRR